MTSRISYLVLGFFLMIGMAGEARRIKTTLKAPAHKSGKAGGKNKEYKGCFEVTQASEAEDTTFRLDQVRFTGFDKKINSSRESFFLTNNSGRTLVAVEVKIEYLTEDGRQLHQRRENIDCSLPSGETRKVDFSSWDKQHSFYYIKSAPTRPTGTPFLVRITPIKLYLKF